MSTRAWQCLLAGLFATAFILAMLGLLLSWGNSAALTTVVCITVGSLILVSVLPHLTEFQVGPKGVVAKVSELETEIATTKDRVKNQEEKVRQHGEQLESQQQVINDLVKYSISASIFHHLCGIAILQTYAYRDGETNRREMYFLRDNGFIRPKRGGFLDFNRDLDGQNLVDIAEATPIGWFCIKLRKSEIPSNMTQDKGNLKVDPSQI